MIVGKARRVHLLAEPELAPGEGEPAPRRAGRPQRGDVEVGVGGDDLERAAVGEGDAGAAGDHVLGGHHGLGPEVEAGAGAGPGATGHRRRARGGRGGLADAGAGREGLGRGHEPDEAAVLGQVPGEGLAGPDAAAARLSAPAWSGSPTRRTVAQCSPTRSELV